MVTISKLSRPYPSAALSQNKCVNLPPFKSCKFPFEVADRSVCRHLPQQHCLSPSACYYVTTCAMSCDTLPLCVGDGEMGVRVCPCVRVCVWGGGGSPVPIGMGPSLDQNLAWHMLPATTGMKYVGTTFIVGKISTGGRFTLP